MSGSGSSGFIPPMKAVSGPLPTGDDWQAELKWDGMRVQAAITGTEVGLRSGSGRDISSTIPELAGLAAAVGVDCVLDGEAVVFADDGPSFSRLQHRIHVASPTPALLEAHPIIYVIFDLLRLGEHDLTPLPLRERRRLLEDLVDDSPGWRVPPASEGNGEALLALAIDRQLEGIVVKKTDSVYRPGGRSPDWVKVKVRRRQEFVVGGWYPGASALDGTIGSLIVGYHHIGDDGETSFRCAGSVGSGLRDSDRSAFLAQFTPLDHSPFHPDHDPVPTGRGPGKGQPRWVEPTEVVEVEFARWPIDGPLWHPTFQGRRIDREPGDVVREDVPVGSPIVGGAPDQSREVQE